MIIIKIIFMLIIIHLKGGALITMIIIPIPIIVIMIIFIRIIHLKTCALIRSRLRPLNSLLHFSQLERKL